MGFNLHDIGQVFVDPFDLFDTKGGGGDPGGEAARLEEERQRRLAEAIRQIDAIFSSPARQAQYQDFVNALRQFYSTEAGRTREEQQRRIKFALARTGQIGGSVDVNARRTLGEEFTRGLLSSERQAQGALAGLKAEDQASRLGLIQMAASGLDVGTAARQASQAMRTNLNREQTAGFAQGLGDLFAGTAQIWQRQKDASERARARRDRESLYDL